MFDQTRMPASCPRSRRGDVGDLRRRPPLEGPAGPASWTRCSGSPSVAAIGDRAAVGLGKALNLFQPPVRGCRRTPGSDRGRELHPDRLQLAQPARPLAARRSSWLPGRAHRAGDRLHLGDRARSSNTGSPNSERQCGSWLGTRPRAEQARDEIQKAAGDEAGGLLRPRRRVGLRRPARVGGHPSPRPIPGWTCWYTTGESYGDFRQAADGTELTVAVQVFGPFLLTGLLMPLLRQSAPARVITVSWGGVYTQRFDLAAVEMDRHR